MFYNTVPMIYKTQSTRTLMCTLQSTVCVQHAQFFGKAVKIRQAEQSANKFISNVGNLL